MRLTIRKQTVAERQAIEQARREGEQAKPSLEAHPAVHSISYVWTTWWVELTYGYRLDEHRHSFAADSIDEVRGMLRDVEHCECESCVKYPRGTALDLTPPHRH